MDRFLISLEGYHELSQVDKSLPRTHLIESCTKAMDQKWGIKRTPGTAQCAELPFKVLLEKEIREHVSNPSISYFFQMKKTFHTTQSIPILWKSIKVKFQTDWCFSFFFQLKNSNDQEIKIKISGEGAKMPHSSNLFVCSFSILDDSQCYLSSSGK